MTRSLYATVLAKIIVSDQLDDKTLPHFSTRTLAISNVGAEDSLSTEEGTVTERIVGRFTTDTTLDLTAVSDPIYTSIDLTGYAMIALLLENSGNGPATVAAGASNGYTPLGSGTITVPAGGVYLAYDPENATVVSSTVKNIDIDATGATLDVVALFLNKST
ncbi:MAG TPA: hypothetical protein P5244_11660 [Syntrophales bacterium]|nr:hypothetical protein [Syntrophales bacterium]